MQRVNLVTGHLLSHEESMQADVVDNDRRVKELITKLAKEGKPAFSDKKRGTYHEALEPLDALMQAREAHDARHHALFDKAIAPLQALRDETVAETEETEESDVEA